MASDDWNELTLGKDDTEGSGGDGGACGGGELVVVATVVELEEARDGIDVVVGIAGEMLSAVQVAELVGADQAAAGGGGGEGWRWGRHMGGEGD